jgi:predicted TIM-barrel fold metal-dependent hydrolase
MIDCDVHQNYKDIKELRDWIDPAFRQYVDEAGFSGFKLPTYPWNHPSGFYRNDAFPTSGGLPGTDYEKMREQLLDPYDNEYAILNGEDILLVSAMAHPQLAAALATAYNRWLIDVWLARDDRFKGSIVVATQDTDRAARDIREFGSHDDVVQVLLPGGARAAYGNKQYLPIFDAAVEMGLTVGIHPSGEGMGMNEPATATGNPTYYAEWHTLLSTVAMSHLVSLVTHAVFERLPGLRVVLLEAGVAWLPSLLWRLDDNWKELRAEVPWVKRLPSETVREQVRIGTQPLEQPANLRKLHQVLESFDGLADMLMFASDYPHWDFDNPPQLMRRFPKEWRKRIHGENARQVYGLPAPPQRVLATSSGA